MSEIHPIRAFRKSHVPPLSQGKLASDVGVTRFTVMRWEKGSPVDMDKLSDVSRVTGIPAKELRPDIAKQFEEEGSEQ